MTRPDRPFTRLARSDTDRTAAFAIRHTVFVDEQGVPPEEEVDARDETADHFIVVADDDHDTIVGTCRVLSDDADTTRIGRLAVLAEHRGNGYALELLSRAENHAARKGSRRVVLDAQLTALAFYERAGYTAHGDVFMDAGIEHVAMTKALEQP